MLIGTDFNDTWGTSGLKPSPHIEGLADYANRMTDLEALLAYQQADTVISEYDEITHVIPYQDDFEHLQTWWVWYNGWSPRIMMTLAIYQSFLLSAECTISVRFGNVDFGTIVVDSKTAGGGTDVVWPLDVPSGIDVGEYAFKLYGRSDALMPWIQYFSAAFVPTKVDV